MGCLKLSFRETGERQNFLSVWRRGTPKKIDHENFLTLGEKNAGKENCIDYYPFGLTFNSYSRENSVPNDYKYNGKELQDELSLNWLDYGARMYDQTLGRWLCIDNKAEKYAKFTPYMYAANNPLIYIDPNGEDLVRVTIPTNADGSKTTQVRIEKNIAKQFHSFVWEVNKKYGVTVNNAFRSQKEQDDLRKRYDNDPEHKGFNARPAEKSNHTGGFALDFNTKGKSEETIKGITEIGAKYGFSDLADDVGHYYGDASEHGYKDREVARETNDQYSQDHTFEETPEYNPENYGSTLEYVSYATVRAHRSEIMTLINQYQESQKRTQKLFQRIQKVLDEQMKERKD